VVHFGEKATVLMDDGYESGVAEVLGPKARKPREGARPKLEKDFVIAAR
jgi:hypothetical protein